MKVEQYSAEAESAKKGLWAVFDINSIWAYFNILILNNFVAQILTQWLLSTDKASLILIKFLPKPNSGVSFIEEAMAEGLGEQPLIYHIYHIRISSQNNVRGYDVQMEFWQIGFHPPPLKQTDVLWELLSPKICKFVKFVLTLGMDILTMTVLKLSSSFLRGIVTPPLPLPLVIIRHLLANPPLIATKQRMIIVSHASHGVSVKIFKWGEFFPYWTRKGPCVILHTVCSLHSFYSFTQSV